MRIHLAIFAAAGVMLAGAVATVGPAHAAGVAAVPAMAFEDSNSGIEKVHRRRYRQYHTGYYQPRHYVERRYYRPYPHPYYGYPRDHRPGVVIQFGFGGGGHYRHGW